MEQKNNKLTEELSQIREEVEKYKSMGDDQCLVFLEDMWVQMTETSSPKSDIILYLQSELAQTYFRLEKFSKSQNLSHDLWEKQKEVFGENNPATLDTEFLLGLTYSSLERFVDALTVFQELLEKKRRVFSKDHPSTLVTEFFIGQTYGDLGRFDNALAVFQDLLEKQRRVFGEEHPTTLDTESRLGQVYASLDRFDDALALCQDLLEKQRRVFGEEHPSTLDTESLLGRSCIFLNRFDSALVILQEVLEKQYRVLGKENPATLNTEFFLGQTYIPLERFDDALVIFQEVLEKRYRVLGKEHPATLSTEFFLGLTYRYLKRLIDALAILQELLEKQRNVLGKDHLATLETASLLGLIYTDLERFDDALAVYQDLLKKQRHVFGEEHPSTLSTEFLLGHIYVSLERFDDALAVCQDLLEKQYHVLGDEHPATLNTQFLLSRTYVSLERFDDALALCQDLLEKQYRLLGDEHPSTLLTEFLLGHIYVSLERFDDALALCQDLLEKQYRLLDDEHPATLFAEYLLGQTYGGLGRFDDALAILQNLLEKHYRVLGEEHPTTLDAEFLLGQTYASFERFDDALAILQNLLEKQYRVLGKEHPATQLTEQSIEEITGIGFENKQSLSSSDESKSLESISFNVPDYGLISSFQPYDFDFNRSKRYSELTGVPLVDSSDSEISGFPRNNTESNFEDIFLEVKNFLNLEYVQLNIKPIMCIYGKNQAGKSNINRLLYGFQYSSNKIIEKLKDWRYKKPVRSLPSELDSLKSKLAEASLIKAQHVHFTIPEDTYNLVIRRLRLLIEEQISQMPSYFYSLENSWAELVGKFDNDRSCHIHSSRSSFNCDVKVNGHNSDKPTIEIDLEPKNSFKIEIELVYESDERNLIGSSIFEVIYNLSSLKIHLSGRQPILIPLKEINLSENLEHLPILHHVMHFSDISHISDQDSTSLKYEEIPKIINNSKMVSKEELEILDNRLVYLIYDTLLIELWKISPFSFFVGDTRFFPAERGGILERMQNNVVRKLLQEDKKVPEGLRQYSRLIDDSLFFREENKNETRSKLPILDQNLLKEIENDLINILYHLELRVSQDEEGASEHVFVKKTQSEDKRRFVLSTLPSSIFSLFALNLHIRLSKLKMILFYEEPETHLHPSSIEKLCDLLVKIYQYIQSGKKHNLAMVFTTHSGFFLNFLFLALERKYGLSNMKEILSVIRLFTDESGGTKSEAIMITEEGYSGSPFDEEELKIYEELTRLYNKYTTD